MLHVWGHHQDRAALVCAACAGLVPSHHEPVHNAPLLTGSGASVSSGRIIGRFVLGSQGVGIMGKSVKQRIFDSFQDDDGSTVQAKGYSENVYAAWKDISASLSRTAILIFLLMAVFELLVYQHTTASISIGGFTLGNAPIVQIVLPTIIAFVIYDGGRLTIRWLNLQTAYSALMRISAPLQHNNGLDFLIRPSLPALWGIGPLYIGDKVDKYMHKINVYVSRTTVFVVPVAFECQAYYRLIQKFGYHNVLLWISLVVTALFGVSAAMTVAIYVRQTSESNLFQ